MENKFVSIVIYLHNSAKNLPDFLNLVVPYFNEGFKQYEMVCVDDGSEDKSVEILRTYAKEHDMKSMINVVHMSYFQGIESAMNAGRDVAIGDFVFEFDDVLVDYDSSLITEIYDKLLSGYDIVSASSKGKSRLTSKLFYSLFNKTSRAQGKIGPETFRIISRRAINRIKSMGQYIPYRKAVYMNCGLKTATIYYASKDMNIRLRNHAVRSERTDLALDSFIYFTNVLERISAIISGIFLCATVGVGIYLISDAFNSNKPVEGWLSTMGFLAIGFFGVFVMLTIILKYLSVLLNLVFKHQRYLVEDIEKIVK